MKQQLQQLQEFHSSFGLGWQDEPRQLDDKTRELRITIMKEELDEVVEAMRSEPLENTAKELADLLYVVYGTIGEYGFHGIMEKICDEVHRSNMSKLDENGKPVRREDGKILKGSNYMPADVKRIVHK